MSNVQKEFNIVGLHNNSVYKDIQIYFNKLSNKSKNTRIAYERHIKQFFMWMCNKKLEQLTIEDLKVRNARVEEYQQHLINNLDLENSSVNSMLGAIVGLYTFLERQDDYRETGVSSKSVELDRLQENSESYGHYHYGEAQLVANEALNQKHKPYEKYLIFKFAYTTSLRQSTILDVTWSDIKFNKEENLYVISVIGKGNIAHKVSISVNFYNELLLIKDEKYYDKHNDNKLFHLTPKTIRTTLNDIKNKLGIEDERNIVFHSFRSVASLYGTLEELKQQLNHSNINTTMKHYRHNNENFSNMISMRMEEQIDDSILNGLSQQQLIDLIMSQDQGTVAKMKRDAMHMIYD